MEAIACVVVRTRCHFSVCVPGGVSSTMLVLASLTQIDVCVVMHAAARARGYQRMGAMSERARVLALCFRSQDGLRRIALSVWRNPIAKHNAALERAQVCI